MVFPMGILLQALGLNTLSAGTPEPVGDYTSNVTPPARDTDPVTVTRALTLPSVYRAVEISAGICSTLGVQAVRGLTPLKVQPSIVLQPDPWRDLSSWIERNVVSLATDGNAFLRKHRTGPGSVASAEVLDPFLTHVRWKKGTKSYTTFDHRAGRFIDLGADDVIHIWGLQIPGRTRGLGPIEACRASLGSALDVRDYASQWFQDGDIPSGVLSSDQNLDPGSVAMYRAIWANPAVFDDQPDATTINRRLGPSVRVLGKGLSYSPVMLKPEDAQWIEAQNWGVLDVARLFGIPGDYLLASVQGSSLTYANLQMIDTQLLRVTLLPKYLRKIEAALTSLLGPGVQARFTLSDYLRPDDKTRAEIHRTYIDAGVLSPQDVRDAERIPGTAPGTRKAATPA